jgi:hypothetical protein
MKQGMKESYEKGVPAKSLSASSISFIAYNTVFTGSSSRAESDLAWRPSSLQRGHPRRNVFAWREDTQVAGQRHWSEGEVSIVVLSDDNASVYLIRS